MSASSLGSVTELHVDRGHAAPQDVKHTNKLLPTFFVSILIASNKAIEAGEMNRLKRFFNETIQI